MRKCFYVILCVAFIMSVASCGRKQETRSQGPEPTSFEKAMTEKDTLAVESLIDQFFQHAIRKEYSEAAAMIYRNDLERSGKAYPLSGEEMALVCKRLQIFPPIDYSIEYIKFNKYKKNEVLCNVVMSKTPDGRPLATTKMFFKPVNNLGTWYLCLMNTDYGDKGVVKPGERDSLQRVYKAKAAQREAAKDATE